MIQPGTLEATKNDIYPVVMGEEGAIKGAFGVSIFPKNIPYEMGSLSELLRVSQPSNRHSPTMGRYAIDLGARNIPRKSCLLIVAGPLST